MSQNKVAKCVKSSSLIKLEAQEINSVPFRLARVAHADGRS